MDSVRRLSTAAKLNVTGLVLTAAGMLLQIAAGSELYPSLTGPIVLLAAAVIVVLGPRRWTPYVGLLVPLVLAAGAIVAAVMTGDFIAQLTDVGRLGILAGSLMHVAGLSAAVAGGVGMLLDRGAARA
jgi:Mg/Co/Ni transporter MgtE